MTRTVSRVLIQFVSITFTHSLNSFLTILQTKRAFVTAVKWYCMSKLVSGIAKVSATNRNIYFVIVEPHSLSMHCQKRLKGKKLKYYQHIWRLPF